MPKIVIRHSLSEANNAKGLAFGHADAPLMEEGRNRIRHQLIPALAQRGIVAANSPVAVSRLLRTAQTATEAGFQTITPYVRLNEVEHGLEGAELRALLDAGGLPERALEHAAALLDNPPAEAIWISHGLVIAGLCAVLGLNHQYERRVPRFCEIRELPIG